MKLRRRRNDEAPEVVLVSLIDVVLSLVIFFMVTTTFNRLAPIEISLPESSADPREKPEQAIEVSIDAQGRYYVAGRELVNTQVETLKKYRLDVPQVTLLAHELHKAGVDIPEGILTKEELVGALCR